MKRRQNGRSRTTITFRIGNKTKLIRASTDDDDESDQLELPLPDNIKMSEVMGKTYVPEAYHNKVANWKCKLACPTRITSICLPPPSPLKLRLSRLSQQDLREVFTISNESHVSELLRLLLKVSKEMNEINEGSAQDALIGGFLSSKLNGVMKNIKIAWASSPFFYFDPNKAMDWLKECLSSYFFFPSQATPDQEKEEENECLRLFFQPARKFLQFERLLAISLRKSIIRSCEACQVPSNLANVAKMTKYAESISFFSGKSIKEAFNMPLKTAIAESFYRCRQVGRQIEEMYYDNREDESKRLIESLEKPVSVKPSKRVKRNFKKAEQKKKKEEAIPKAKNDNPSINPQETTTSLSIVDPNAYKFGEHEGDSKTPATSSQESKSQTTLKMFTDYFVPLAKEIEPQWNDTASTASKNKRYRENTSSNVKPYRKRNSNGQRFYEEKPNFTTEAINKENHANKAAFSVFNGQLEKKMVQLVKKNAEVYGYKNYSYRLLLTYFEERWPNYSVDLFGSLATGVTLPNSDIDLLLSPLQMVGEYFMSNLADELSNFQWVTYSNPILTAKIPVIKLIIDPQAAEGNYQSQYRQAPHDFQLKRPQLIKFDITLNTLGPYNTGLVSSAYMQNVFSIRPKLTEAIVVVKDILDASGLNEGYKGGISSYNVFIMFICFTEHIQFSFDAPLSEFLYKFFRFYTKEFDHRKSVIKFQPGGRCFISFSEYNSLQKAENLGSSGALKMIDPINGQLVRASFSRFEEVVNLFRQLAEAFEEVREEARVAVQPLMGKANNKWEISSTLEANVVASSSARKLELLLLVA